MKIATEKRTSDFSLYTTRKTVSRFTYINIAKRDSLLIIFLMVGTITASSCTSPKNNILFKDLPNDTILSNLVSKDFQPTIQRGDLLNISVGSLSPENTILYNIPQNIIVTQPGYLVDENGNIQFVKLGTLAVAGLTRKELKSKLEDELKPYLTEVIVAIGFLNRKVTLMGALSPKVIPINQDHMTILDALATGGGIGEGGKLDNVLVIRENDSVREFKLLNLTDKSLFYSPYFYVQPNDIIYVEPIKKKAENLTRIIGYTTAGLSLAIFLIERVFKVK
ncbi:MAG: polysaccharide biosynthesis/export family protein [Ginsengibacter sp.]